MFSSEQKLSINGETLAELKAALKFAFDLEGHIPVCYQYLEGKVIFYGTDLTEKNDEEYFKFPKNAGIETIANIVFDYLKSADANAFFKERQDDIDGSIYKGWQIFIPTWNDLKGQNSWYAIFGVKHDWIYYAK